MLVGGKFNIILHIVILILIIIFYRTFSDLGRHVEDSPVPTPFIDNLTARGVHLAQHYVHSVCSPSRAALLTGRYHVNTGLTNVLIPGTPAGNILYNYVFLICFSCIILHNI